MEISEILSYIQSGVLYEVLALFLVGSYLLFALFNWSFVKPLKYFGVSSIIVGILLLIVRFGNMIEISMFADIKVPTSLIGAVFKPFLVMGIVYIAVGILLIVLQRIYYKKK